MYRYIVYLIFSACLILSSLEALQRDYCVLSPCYGGSNYYCHDHVMKYFSLNEIQSDLLKYIPVTEYPCKEKCGKQSIFSGYVDRGYRKYNLNLEKQLYYSREHADCTCLWPECSSKAAQISDTAYNLFQELIFTTALYDFFEYSDRYTKFFGNFFTFNGHGLTISFIIHQFRFSDYYYLCRDIENFTKTQYEEGDAIQIKDKLESILEILYQQFFDLYISCYKKHPNTDIDQEIRFMKLLVNDTAGFETTIIPIEATFHHEIEQNHYVKNEFTASSLTTGINAKLDILNTTNVNVPSSTDNVQKIHPLMSSIDSHALHTHSFQFDFFLIQGSLYNDYLLHGAAIKILTQAIQINPHNRNAYIERAMAYFETNQLELAFQDYESVRKLTITSPIKPDQTNILYIPNCIPENQKEFSIGLVSGIVNGAQTSAKDFFPSIFNCYRGILNGLWAFACSPTEVSQEVIQAAYALGNYISTHSMEECIQCAIPEIKELSLSWKRLDDRTRGQKFGYIIGKYGIDIFGSIGLIKGVNTVRALKRANALYTLESCVNSLDKKIKILERSAKQALLRKEIIADSIKNGKLLIKDYNKKIHIMQPKHAWDKLIKLSGNIEEDCGKVVELLEKNKIFLEKYRKTTITRPDFIQYDHMLRIKDHEIVAVFYKNPETGEVFLSNAWVVTK